MDPAAEVSHRMLGGASLLPGEEAREGNGVEIAQVGEPAAAGEAGNPPGAVPLLTEGNEEAVLDKQQDGAAPAVSDANMDVDEAPLASEGTEHQAATESKAEVNDVGVLEKRQDVAAPVVNESKMEVDDSSALEKEHTVVVAPSEVRMEDPVAEVSHRGGEAREGSGVEITQVGLRVAVGEAENTPAATPLLSVGNEDTVLDKQQDVTVPVVSESKMEVDESSAADQDHAVVVAPREVTMEEGDSRAVDQQPNTSDGGPQVKEDEEGECLVGRYVSSSASDDGTIRLGKVASYDGSIGVYNVVFEDGQAEELGLPQLSELLMVQENGASGMKVSCRKRKLDLLVSPGSVKQAKGPPSTRQRVVACEMPARPDVSQQTWCDLDLSGNAKSSSNSSDFTKELPSELCLGPELPPSSSDIAVPGESISHLFSVYNFLRSFNVQLFLSPFGLDDFVASINCTVQNTLLDAVHVSLLRALRRHLEAKSSHGSELASNCLKYVDWALLDVLTWPTFLLEYLYLMGYIKSLGGQSFGRTLLGMEYYMLPVTTKLRLLQILCDHVTESEELKGELEAREGYNEEMEYEADSIILSESESRAVLTRAAKASVCEKIEGLQSSESAPNVTNQEAALPNASQDGNSDDCQICGMDGTLVCCDGCPWAYHSRCIGQNKAFLPQGLWFCPECVVNKLGPASSRIERGARGAQMFGIDMCGRLFLGSCNYLLVIGTSTDAGSYARYYNQYDVVKVVQILASSDAYTDICRRMTEYWKHQLDMTEYWKHLLDIFQNERSKIGKEAGAKHATQSNTSSSVTPIKAGVGSVLMTTLTDGGDSKTVVIPQINVQHESVTKQSTVCSMERLEKQKCTMTNVGTATEKNNGVCMKTPLAPKDMHNAPRNGAFEAAGISSISHQNEPVVTGVSSAMRAQPSHGLVRPDFSSSGGKSAKVSSFKPRAYMNLYNHGSVAASAAANLAILTSDKGKVSTSQLATNLRKKTAADCALQVKAFSSPAAQFVWPSTEKKIMEVPRDKCGWCLACKSSASGGKKACFLNLATANAAKGSARVLSPMYVIKSAESHFPSIAAYLVNMEESLRGLLVGSLQDMQQRQRWHKQLQEASNCKTIVPLLLELESNIRSVAFSPSWVKLLDDWPLESPAASAGTSHPTAYQKRGTGGRRGRKRSLATESAAVTDNGKSWKKVNWWSGGNVSKRILQRGAYLSSAIRKVARQGGKKKIAGLSYHDCSNLPRRTRQFAWRACVGLSENSSQLALQVRYLDTHIRWKEFVPPDQTLSDGKSSDLDFYALRNAVLCDKKIVDNKIRYALKFPNQKHLPVRVTKNILEAEDNQDRIGKLWFSENHVPLYLVREFEQKPGVTSLPTAGIVQSNCFTSLYQRRVKASSGDVFSYLFHKGDIYPCTSCKKDVPFRHIVRCTSCQGNCHKLCTVRSVGGEGDNGASSLICKLCHQKRNLILTSYPTKARYALPQKKSTGQLPVSAPKIIFKVSSSCSAEPAVTDQAQPIAMAEAQAVVKVEAKTVTKAEDELLAKVEALRASNVQTRPITEVKPWPVNWSSFSVARLQAQANTEAKKPMPEKTRKRRKKLIKYFGLSWKKSKNDNRGSAFRANDVILKCKDGMGSAIKPTCCLCKKSYCPDFLYVRCEQCKAWFHGDALQLEEEKILEVVQYRCCRCRRQAIPSCPHSDDYENPDPEFSEKTVATSSQSSMLSSEETASVSDQDPRLASYGTGERIGEETFDADLSMNVARFTPGTNQKLSIRRPQGKTIGYVDQAGIPVNGYHNQNQPPADANLQPMQTSIPVELDGVDASELLDWDHTANCQWNEASCGSAATGDFEPQPFSRFTDLLEAEDARFASTFGMSSGLQGNGNYTRSFDQEAISFDDVDLIIEDGSSNMHFPVNDPPPDEAPCTKCKKSQPSPDLNCSVCGMHIHRQCSPWDESDLPAESADWACGGCREWR
uniref:Uncharacterized protein n=1 Tax=Avena sativa TaxID=4498 RepID=A0ACD6A152_AVESA